MWSWYRHVFFSCWAVLVHQQKKVPSWGNPTKIYHFNKSNNFQFVSSVIKKRIITGRYKKVLPMGKQHFFHFGFSIYGIGIPFFLRLVLQKKNSTLVIFLHIQYPHPKSSTLLIFFGIPNFPQKSTDGRQTGRGWDFEK